MWVGQYLKKNLCERDVHLLMEIVTDGRPRVSYMMCYGFVLLLFYVTIDDTGVYTNVTKCNILHAKTMQSEQKSFQRASHLTHTHIYIYRYS